MLETIRTIIQKYQLITPSNVIVVGVSGGADSLALLHVLYTLSSQMGFRIHAATLDHSLRGMESANDVRYVEALCHEWGIPVTAGKVDVAALGQQRHLSMESAARLARYDYLAETARTVGAARIAVAHHANDQAETILLRLLRGSGTHGLRGMAWTASVPGHADLTVIRPFLQVTRAEIEAYCQENAITPRQDSSNDDATILRNYLRLTVFPGLEKHNPRVQRVLTQLADIAAVEDDYLQEQLNRITSGEAVVSSEGRLTIWRAVFADLHPALQRRFVAWAAEQLNHAEDVDYTHIVDAVHLALKGELGSVALFAGGLQLRVDYETIVIEQEDAPVTDCNYPLLSSEHTISLRVPSVTVLDGWELHISPTPPAENMPICRLALLEGAVVTLRTRREGERFAPLGLGGHSQKLNRWMINRKVPRLLREQIPLVCINNQIAAILIDDEWSVSEYFAVRSDDKPVIYLYYRRIA